MDKIVRSPVALDVPGIVGFVVAVAVAVAILKKLPSLPIVGKLA